MTPGQAAECPAPAGGRRRLVVASLAALLGACASQPPVESIFTPDQRVDMSGSWEIDYSRSDRVDRTLRTLLLRLQSGGYPGVDPGGQGYAAPRSRESLNAVVALAQLAEEITASPVLEIDQTDDDIAVERDETFALTCVFHPDRPLSEQGPLGSELCGWVNERLVFQTGLPDGLTIFRQFTLAPDGQQLHVATTLRSPGAAAPFTISRFYNRFEPVPGSADQGCRETLTRGRVCERSAQR